MHKKISTLALILAVVALGVVVLRPAQNGGETPVKKETAFERVMRTRTLRCGYGVWEPLVMKDPNTKKISGIFYDYMEALGQALHLKVEWTEELGFGDFPAAIAAGRIDGMCAGIWPNASRALQVDFTTPILYVASYPWARADDHRFDDNLGRINNPSIVISSIDGEMAGVIAARDFPNAKTLQLPQMSGSGEMFTNVVSGKADITFSDPVPVASFNKNNQNKLRRVSTKFPVRVFGNTIAIAQGEDRLRRMIDVATEEMIASGQIEKIIVKYEQFPNTLLRAAPPYIPQ